MASAPPILAALLTAWILAGPATAQNRRRPPAPAPLEHGTFKEVRFESEALDKEVGYGVYLPEGYDDEANDDKRYPLVVWLHGMWEDAMRFHNRGGSKTLDEMIGNGEVPPLVLVCPSAGRSSFYINGKSSGREEDMLVKDFLSHVDVTYRVEADRQRRVIMGVSFGGMGALKTAFRHPQLFGTVAVHSSAIFPADLDNLSPRFKRAMESRWLGPALDEVFGKPIDEELWREHAPLALVANTPKKDLDSLHIYFDAGTADRYGFADGNELLHAVMTEREVKHTWRKIEGGGHSWGDGLAKNALPDSLRFVAQQLAAEKGRGALKGMLGPGRDGK